MIARLDERSNRASADQLVREWGVAGTRAGAAFSQGANSAMAATSSAAVSKFNDAIDRYAAALPSRMTGHGQRAGESFGGAFSASLARSLPGVSGFASMLGGYDSTAGRVGAVAGRALGMAFTGAATGLIGAAAYTMFKGFERYEAIDAAKNRLENLNRTLQSTGKAGIDVKAVMDTVNKVVLDTPFALDKAFSVATRALASNTGDLKRFMTDVADASGFAGEGIDEIGDAFLKVANQGKVSMDEISNELRNIPIMPWLQETLHVTGGELAKMLRENKVGLEDLLKTIEQHAPGFAKASGNTIKGALENLQTSVARSGANLLGAIFGKPTEDSNQLVEVLKTLRQRFDEIGAWISAHQTDIRDFFKTAADVGKDVVTVMGEIAKFLSEHKRLVEDVIVAYAGWKAIQGITSVITGLSRISTLLRGIPAEAAIAGGAMNRMGAASAAGGAAAGAAAGGASRLGALGRFLGPIGVGLGAYEIGQAQDRYNRSNPGTVDPNSPFGQWINSQQGQQGLRDLGVVPGGGSKPNSGPMPFDSAPVPGDGLHWEDGKGWVLDEGLNPEYLALPGMDRYRPPAAAPHGGPILPPSGDSDKDKKPHLPKAPVVPYDTSLPPGFENLPMSASLYGAESSFLDARFKLAEKQARLQQLEHDNNATAQDILDARNDVITAGRDQQQAELRLYEARQEIFDKQAKQFKDWRSQLGEIGASLDQDFGISKGLAGIVENITKMLANMAAAPIIGALRGVQIGMGQEPGAAGSGIVGMLAAGGAFGPTLQGDSRLQSLRNASGAGGGVPGIGYPGVAYGGGGPYPGDAALLANIPAGRYLQTQAADLTQGIGDCSSAIEDLVNILDGRSTSGRSMSTANEAAWLTAHGFLPGMGGPGDFRVGFNSGHTQATLPGGTPFNWGSDAAAAARGIGGTGADDPALTSHYYRPMGGGGVPAGGVPGISLSGGPTTPAPATPAPLPLPPSPPKVWTTAPPAPTPQPAPAPPGSTSGGNALSPGFFVPGAQPGAAGAPAPGGGIGGGSPFPGRGGPPAAGGPHGPSWIGSGAAGGSGLEFPNPGGGPSLGPTLIGGNAPPEGMGGGFTGGGGGGLIGMGISAAQSAISAAGMAGDAMGGGGGASAGAAVANAAIQIAVQEINRAIGFGAQAAGIGVAGLMETFLPMGASELAQNNWLTRIAGGIIGARPAMPNLAGGGNTKKGLTPEQAAQLEASKKQPTPEGVANPTNDPNGPKAPGAGPASNTTNHNNNSVTNNVTITPPEGRTADGVGRDMTYNLNQQYAPAGIP